MAQRFIVMKYKSILPTCMIPEPGDPMGADSYAYTSLKYTYTSLKYAGVVAEPLSPPPWRAPSAAAALDV